MFKQARIKLTVFYMLILMTVTIFFSVIEYKQIVTASEVALSMQARRMERQMQRLGYPPRKIPIAVFQANQAELKELKNRIISGLIFLNVIILGISSILSYFLAGKTLKPIEKMMSTQQRFFTDAAHELKTPLTAIKTNLEVTLRDKELKLNDAKEVMSETISEVDKLNSLASVLLQTERAKSVEDFKQVNLTEIIKNVVQKIEPIAESKQQTIKVETLDAVIEGNATELDQVFTNLVDNAIKYSPNKTQIFVVMSKKNKYIEIKVQDQGVGIPEADLPHIFEPFYRADKARSNSNSFGLGLSIVKTIVDKHGGKISVETSPQGSTFTVRFPTSA